MVNDSLTGRREPKPKVRILYPWGGWYFPTTLHVLFWFVHHLLGQG